MNTIRRITKDEIPLLPAIEESADSLFTEVGILDLPEIANEDEYKNSLCILVADKPPKGFIRIEEVDGNAHIEQVSVQRESMGSGIGSALIEAACAWAKEQGYRGVTLITFAGIQWNEPLYKKCGFTSIEELTPGLIALRNHEKALGLDNLGVRVVMQRSLL